MEDVSIRPARPDRDDGERFAHYFDIASDGLLQWMLGSGYQPIVAKAFLEQGHDFSYDYVWFAESGGVVAGMVNGYSASDHALARGGPMFRAAGFRLFRLVGAWLIARRLFTFMDRVPEGDWYLQGLAVDPAYQGAGVGSLLIDHAESVAAGSGSQRLALDVAVDNDGARRLYERRGMEVEATSPSISLVPGNAVHRMAKVLADPAA